MPKRIKWSQLSPALGSLPDAQVARNLGTTPAAVTNARRKRGITPFAPKHARRHTTPKQDTRFLATRTEQIIDLAIQMHRNRLPLIAHALLQQAINMHHRTHPS